MANSPKNELLRLEIRKLLENLLLYDEKFKLEEGKQSKVITNWNQNRFKVRTKLKNLLSEKIYQTNPPSYRSAKPPSQQKQTDRLRYLLLTKLKKELELLEDNRAKNTKKKPNGIPAWNFTLKLRYSPEEMSYIQRNLRFFDRRFHKVYGTQSTEQPIITNLLATKHTKFFGYESELDRLLELLLPKSRTQTICIEGMGGSGKTTLADEVAHYCLEISQDKTHPLYFDALIFISAKQHRVVGDSIMPRLLGVDRYVEDIVRRIAGELDFPLEPALDFERQLELLMKYLKQKLLLLIIDNLETIEERDAVANLIADFPDTVKVIVTSRIPFVQPNSCSITLTHLQPEAGAELIEDLAKKFQRILSRDQITSIYKRTGGLPLAITYLVAQIITTGIPDELIPDLVNQTPDELLKFCFADLVKSLSSTPAYQYLLIAALFAEFASTEAIAFINQTTEQITSENLQHLANLHLLFSQKAEQYSLHSLTQEYLQLELGKQPDYEAQIRERQVQWYLQLVEPYSFLSADEWHNYQELETEWINLRSIVEWCILCDRYSDVKNFWQGLKGFTRILGYWTEKKIWLDWLLDEAIKKQDWQMVAEAKFQQSQTLARIDQSDASGKAMKLAQEAWNLKEHCSAEWQFDLSSYVTALYIRQQNPEVWKIAQQWCDLSQKLLDTFKETIRTYSKKQCQLAYYQAEIHSKAQELERALNTYQNALKTAENINYQRGIAYIRSRIAVILIQQNQLTEARQELITLLELTKRYRDRRACAFCHQYLAVIAKQQMDLEEAKHYATIAQEDFNNLGMEIEAAKVDKFLAEV